MSFFKLKMTDKSKQKSGHTGNVVVVRCCAITITQVTNSESTLLLQLCNLDYRLYNLVQFYCTTSNNFPQYLTVTVLVRMVSQHTLYD